MDGGMMAGMIAGYGVAVVGAVLMAVFGSMALSEDAELADTCGVTGSCTAEQVADADTFALVSDVGLALTIAGVAAGTVFLILGLTSPVGGESASITPWFTPEGGGVAVRGRF
jgi:hypothetical protein